MVEKARKVTVPTAEERELLRRIWKLEVRARGRIVLAVVLTGLGVLTGLALPGYTKWPDIFLAAFFISAAVAAWLLLALDHAEVARSRRRIRPEVLAQWSDQRSRSLD